MTPLSPLTGVLTWCQPRFTYEEKTRDSPVAIPSLEMTTIRTLYRIVVDDEAKDV